MSKRFFKSNNASSPAKKLRLDVTREPVVPKEKKSHNVNNDAQNDVWGDDFQDDEIQEMDFIASQATQEEAIFIPPKLRATGSSTSSKNSPLDPAPSTSSGIQNFFQQRNVQRNVAFNPVVQSQVIHSSDINKEIFESTQAIMFDDFEKDIKDQSTLLNSTLRSRQDATANNVILVTDDDQVEKLKIERKKLLEDFMTKEGETEFLRQQLNQIQTRAENAKKEQARLMEEQMQKYRAEINGLIKEKTSLESQLQLQKLQLNSATEKCKLLESGSVKFTQPQVNMVKSNRDRSNTSTNWTPKKAKTKESSVQVEKATSVKLLKTNIIDYPLKIIPKCIFETPEPEKSVVDIKIEEKIGKRNLAIIQEEETFRIFENPELSKPKVTVVGGKTLSTEFIVPDLTDLMNKTSAEINSVNSIPTINKIIATTRELLLNSTQVLRNISQALQNDDIRDMNELYLSEFYEMPVPHTKCVCESRAWYDLERGVETRRAVGILSYICLASKYLAHYIAGNVKLNYAKDSEYESYARQMKSYNNWSKKGHDFEFLDLIVEFVTVVGIIRRSHQFTGLINALLTLIINVQSTVGFTELGVRRVLIIFKELVYSRPLLSCFIPLSSILKDFSKNHFFASKLCINPDKSGINYWKGSLNFTPDGCVLENFIAQLEYFKLDPITIINITKDLALFSNIAVMNTSIPWLELTLNSCNCCLTLLKLIVNNLYQCSKIKIDELKRKYTEDNISWRISKLETNNKKNSITWKDELFEDWKSFEKDHKENFWDRLNLSQSLAITHGIRLLSFLAKRDLDFTIRHTSIADGFHLFLNHLDRRKDIQLKKSDEIALEIVKRTFILDKNKEETRVSQHKTDIVLLEQERWIDIVPTYSQDLTKLYEH